MTDEDYEIARQADEEARQDREDARQEQARLLAEAEAYYGALRMKDLVAAVREHALAHYEEGGWDILTECYDDAQIINDIGTATNVPDAIKNVARTLGIIHEYREEIRATAF